MNLRCLCTQSETGATWPQQTGQDFSTNYATPGIDFSAIHMWVDDWNEVCTQCPPNAATSQGTAKPMNVVRGHDMSPEHACTRLVVRAFMRFYHMPRSRLPHSSTPGSRHMWQPQRRSANHSLLRRRAAATLQMYCPLLTSIAPSNRHACLCPSLIQTWSLRLYHAVRSLARIQHQVCHQSVLSQRISAAALSVTRASVLFAVSATDKQCLRRVYARWTSCGQCPGRSCRGGAEPRPYIPSRL